MFIYDSGFKKFHNLKITGCKGHFEKRFQKVRRARAKELCAETMEGFFIYSFAYMF